jgi:hypothetical protein
LHLVVRDSDRSTLEIYVELLFLISYGVSLPVEKHIDFLIKQGLVEQNSNRSLRTVLILTEKGTRVLKFFIGNHYVVRLVEK